LKGNEKLAPAKSIALKPVIACEKSVGKTSNAK
jgi:hypothetical protein